MFTVGALAVSVMLAVGFCLWKLPDPHHQQIASLLPLLDPDRTAETPPAVTSIRLSHHKDIGVRSA